MENVRRVHVDHLEEKWDGTRTGMETDDEEMGVYPRKRKKRQERNDGKEAERKAELEGKWSLKKLLNQCLTACFPTAAAVWLQRMGTGDGTFVTRTVLLSQGAVW